MSGKGPGQMLIGRCQTTVGNRVRQSAPGFHDSEAMQSSTEMKRGAEKGAKQQSGKEKTKAGPGNTSRLTSRLTHGETASSSRRQQCRRLHSLPRSSPPLTGPFRQVVQMARHYKAISGNDRYITIGSNGLGRGGIGRWRPEASNPCIAAVTYAKPSINNQGTATTLRASNPP